MNSNPVFRSGRDRAPASCVLPRDDHRDQDAGNGTAARCARHAAPAILAAACALLLATAHAELIPAARMTAWAPGVNVGVLDGIPTSRTNIIDITKAPYNADRSGAQDCSDIIASAIKATASGDIVYLPAGTYRVAKPITVFNQSNFTIRGDGDSTVLMSYCGYPGVFYFGASADYLWNYPSTGVAVKGGLGKGSTTITLADTSLFSPGQLVQIKEDDDHVLPVMNFGARTGSHGATQKTRVMAKTATTLTISPGLYWTMQSGLNPRVYAGRGQAERIGIEDLKIDGTNSTSTYVIWLEQCLNSWIKNVHIASAYQYMIFLMDCLNVEVRHCYIDASKQSGPNGAGLLVEGTCASLFEDNIFYKTFPHLEVNFGSCGNVFAYNFCEDSTVYGAVGASIDANHGPHNRLNLYEGNISPLFQSDGYFGSASEDTVFRNWLHGTSPGATGVRQPIILNRFTRNYSVISNILGRPGVTYSSFYLLGVPQMGNSNYTGTAQLSASRPWADWSAYLAGTYTGGTNNGFLELDLDVAASALLVENYNTGDAAIPASEASADTPLTTSLYRSAKPVWFGSLAWPAFDPHAPNMKYDAIPAGYRYVHGTEPPADRLVQPPISVRIEVAAP
jgi:hypothetical protein